MTLGKRLFVLCLLSTFAGGFLVGVVTRRHFSRPLVWVQVYYTDHITREGIYRLLRISSSID